MSQQELEELIFNQLQRDFTDVKTRVSYPASNYNRDLANKLSIAISEYLDNFLAKINEIVNARTAQALGAAQSAAAQASAAANAASAAQQSANTAQTTADDARRKADDALNATNKT